MIKTVSVLFLAYLLGSIPCTYLMGLWLGIDLSRRGSGNLGGTNAVRILGALPGLAAGLGDICKTILAVYLARRISSQEPVIASAAIAATLGHNYSLYLGFAKGGKGVSPAIGVFLLLAPLPVLPGLGLGLIIVLLTRYVSLGALVFMAVLPPLLFFFGEPRPYVLAALAMACLAYWRHRSNIKRLIEGTERRIGRVV